MSGRDENWIQGICLRDRTGKLNIGYFCHGKTGYRVLLSGTERENWIQTTLSWENWLRLPLSGTEMKTGYSVLLSGTATEN